MAEERYSLKAAADLYGVKPNAIRARFKKGQIRGERDNQGRIFVWIDPAQAANDKQPREPSLKPSTRPEKSGELKALKDHIETLTNERDRLRAEIDRLRENTMDRTHVETLLQVRDDKIAELERELAERDHQNREIDAALRKTEQELQRERRRGVRGLWRRLFGR